MKKRILVLIISLLVSTFAFAQQQTINNGETGLQVRTKLNEMFTDLFDNIVNIQFSIDGSTDWHDTYTSADRYWRITRDLGSTWSNAIYLWTEDVIEIFETDTLVLGTDTITSFNEAGWDSLTVTDDNYLKWWNSGSVIDSVLLVFSGNVYSITLPSASTIAGRISAASEGTDYPSGWVLAAGTDPADIDITHSLGMRVASVNVFYNVSGTENRQLINFNNAYTGILTTSVNQLRIEGLTTIQKEIQIYITFTE
jgi:hypothetical protein